MRLVIEKLPVEHSKRSLHAARPRERRFAFKLTFRIQTTPRTSNATTRMVGLLKVVKSLRSFPNSSSLVFD